MATNLMSSPSVFVIYSIVKRVTNLVSSHVSIRAVNFIISFNPINLLNGWHLLFLLYMQTWLVPWCCVTILGLVLISTL